MKEISSHTNEYIKVLKSLKQKKSRDEHGLYIIEGQKCIDEAILFHAPIKSVLISDKNPIDMAMFEKMDIEIICVPHTIIQQISDTKSPPNIIACLQKHETLPELDKKFYVATDDVNDPKNLGTIIRTADAVGADGVFVSQNSADVFGPKVQRAAMGSTFHIPVQVCGLKTTLEAFKNAGGAVVCGSLKGREEFTAGYEKVCVVIGNEARGISHEILELADELYKIKIYGQAESLNASVAAGILLYDMKRCMK
ncbi:MAG: RNA methyltransferase [Christensenellaceae bacterium]